MKLIKLLIYSASILSLFSCKDTKQVAEIPKCLLKPPIDKYIRGNSMKPMLVPKDKVLFFENYYALCKKKIQREDIVLYQFAYRKTPVIKIVKGTYEDRIEIKGTKIFINDSVMKNSKGQEYSFSKQELKMLGLYIKNGKIPSNSFLLFGDNTHSSLDSRKFGAVSQSNILGKVIKSTK